MKARLNPLRVERVLQVRFRLDALEDGLTLDELLNRWEKLGRRAAFIGPHGSGKSTLLEDLAALFETRHSQVLNLRLSTEKRRFSADEWRSLHSLTARTVILLDGAEQLSFFDWARFKYLSKKADGTLITSHRAGLLPTLIECCTSPRLLREILHQILGNDAAVWDVKCEALWTRHQGDLRLALREIYDVYAAAAEDV
jgi:energy-coupling factor transporter ATP-binding protein EcfA2